MAWKPIRVRLRPGKDDEIAKALDEASEVEDRSDIVRAALRYYLLNKKNTPKKHEIKITSNEEIALQKTKKTNVDIDAGLDNLLDNF